MSGATVTISLDELDELRAKLKRANEDCGNHARRIQELEREGAGDRSGELLICIQNALEVVRFAVSNLDPATIRGWPWRTLKVFADDLEKLPGADAPLVELAIELRAFARECEAAEHERRTRPLPRPAPAPPPAADPEPTA